MAIPPCSSSTSRGHELDRFMGAWPGGETVDCMGSFMKQVWSAKDLARPLPGVADGGILADAAP
eukprot:82923-Ditylum_brightwellii.AAC.1